MIPVRFAPYRLAPCVRRCCSYRRTTEWNGTQQVQALGPGLKGLRVRYAYAPILLHMVTISKCVPQHGLLNSSPQTPDAPPCLVSPSE